MRKLVVIVFAFAAWLNLLHAEDKVLDPSQYDSIKKMNAVLGDPVLSIEGVLEKPETYVLKLMAKSPQGSQLLFAYLDKSSHNLYMGTGYIQDGHPLLFPKDTKAIKEGVSFSYGKGKKELYLVTDPECPYCLKFSKAAAGKLGDYRIHVLFFPLSFHKNSPAMIEWIMQGKDDAARKKRYDEIMLKDSKAYASFTKDANSTKGYSDAVQKEMDKTKKATLELNVRGTPMLFDANFQPVQINDVLKQEHSK